MIGQDKTSQSYSSHLHNTWNLKLLTSQAPDTKFHTIFYLHEKFNLMKFGFQEFPKRNAKVACFPVSDKSTIDQY